MKYEEKYDKLLSSFYYINNHGHNNIGKYYPDSDSQQHKKHKKHSENKSNHSHSKKSVKSTSSKASNLKISDVFKRKING